MGQIEDKMQEAKHTLLNANNYMNILEQEFCDLKLKGMSVDKVKDYIDFLLPVDESDTARKIRNIEDLRADLVNRYMYAPDLMPIEHSAYRFVNAVSDFATHRDPKRNTQNYKENLFMKTIDGNALIDKAYKMCVAA